MNISGLTLFKLLPGGQKLSNTNCKECGFSTCMAFAMKLAKGEISIDKCKYASDEIKDFIEDQCNKSQVELSFGLISNPIKIGGETVLYRHEKTFINPTCLSIRIKVSIGVDNVINKLNQISNFSGDRIGEVFKIDSITLDNDTQNENELYELIKTLNNLNFTQKFSFILQSKYVEELLNCYKLISNIQKPLLYLKNFNNELSEYNKIAFCPVCIDAIDYDDLINKIKYIESIDIKELVINIPDKAKKNVIESLTLIRRSVILNNFKYLRYPVITFASDYCKSNDDLEEGLWAGNLICKYSNIVVLDTFNPSVIYSLLTLRQSLFTDPQKPLQIEPNLYPIGEVTTNSPVIVTTNFALTYFSVSSEIEASNIPCYLLITPSDGMSVLTAWAANKFTGKIIAKAIKENSLETKVKHRNIIIAGSVSCLAEEIEEDALGWSVEVAPNEAIDIPEYLKNNLHKYQ